jgi:hypothetical protein
MHEYIYYTITYQVTHTGPWHVLSLPVRAHNESYAIISGTKMIMTIAGNYPVAVRATEKV